MTISTASATTIHSGLSTHHQLQSICLHSFNTTNTTVSTPTMLTPPDDLFSIFLFTTDYTNHIFREAAQDSLQLGHFLTHSFVTLFFSAQIYADYFYLANIDAIICEQRDS